MLLLKDFISSWDSGNLNTIGAESIEMTLLDKDKNIILTDIMTFPTINSCPRNLIRLLSTKEWRVISFKIKTNIQLDINYNVLLSVVLSEINY